MITIDNYLMNITNDVVRMNYHKYDGYSHCYNQ